MMRFLVGNKRHSTALERPRTLHKWLRDKSALAGGLVTLIFITIAALAPVVAPHNPYYMEFGQELSGPSVNHPLGTDEFGRDIASRVIHGARISIVVGVGGVLGAVLLGTCLGLIAGFSGSSSTIDGLIMQFMDTLLAFPAILIGIITVVILGTDTVNMAIAIAVAQTPLITRLVRGEVLREREKEYVQAIRALGGRPHRIVLKHLLPGCTNVILVEVCASLGVAILLEASLSFLGLGAQPPTPSWGSMLRESRQYLGVSPVYAIAPGAALTLLIVAANMFARGFRFER